jgi:hypothetical protein
MFYSTVQYILVFLGIVCVFNAILKACVAEGINIPCSWNFRFFLQSMLIYSYMNEAMYFIEEF